MLLRAMARARLRLPSFEARLFGRGVGDDHPSFRVRQEMGSGRRRHFLQQRALPLESTASIIRSLVRNRSDQARSQEAQ